MASITTADFRNGMGLKIKDKYYTIVEFQHVKPGKGGAFVRYKTKDLKTGRVVENTCNAGSKFESVQLITNEMQYLYNDGDNYYFMDMSSYEQIAVPADFIGDNAKWLRENDNAQLLYADTELLGVNPPMFIEAEVVDDKLRLTVHLTVFFGYPFKKLAEVVREAVVSAIDAQVGVEVESVNICIDSLVFPKE